MPRTPNIIYIYADDLGRGMLSCYGQKHFRTPNIDRLAGEGVRFTNYYGCSFCAPARASLLIGQHDCHRGTWTFSGGHIYKRYTSGQITLEGISELLHTTGLQPGPGDVFLADVARRQGYVTAQIGKLEWGFATSDRDIRSHGWDYHYGYYDHGQCHGFYPPYLFENGAVVRIPGNTRDDFGIAPGEEKPGHREQRWDLRGKAVYSQDLFDAKILEFIRANRDKPFLLYHPSQLPHGPISIPAIHPSVAGNPALTPYEKEYASMVLRLDHTVGLILDELQRLGIDEDTLVMFTSDNGHECYYQEEGRCCPTVNLRTGTPYDDITTKHYSELSGDVFDGNDGMAGKKWNNFEGGVRIPALVRWPGHVQAGRVSDRLLANYDVLPTVADLTGAPCPAGKDGLSFVPELLGAADPAQGHEHVLFASRLGPAMVTREGWKLRFIRLEKQNLYQLYHLPDDYREERNIIHEGPRDVVNRMSTVMLRECDGNYLNGTPETHHVWFPGWEFYGPECRWQLRD